MQKNSSQFVGRIVRDLETKQVGNNGAIYCRTRLAVNESLKKGEEWQEHTTWANLVFWNRLVKQLLDQDVKKGTELYVEGCYRQSQYEDANGQKQISHYFEIHKFAKIESRKAVGVKGSADELVKVESVTPPAYPNLDDEPSDLPF